MDRLLRDGEPVVSLLKHEVDLHARVELRVVGAIMGTARLPALDSSLDGGLGDNERATQVESVGQVVEALGGRPDVDVVGSFPDLRDPPEAFVQLLLVPHHTAGLLHGVAQGPLQGTGELLALLYEGGNLLGGLSYGGSVAELHIGIAGELRCGLAGAPSEDDGLREGVTPEAIGPVQAGRVLALGVQSLDAR